MNRETALTATIAFSSPIIVPRRLPEDASQALMHITSILSLNDEADIEPGDLYGMSRVLANAKRTWKEMLGNGPTAFMSFAPGAPESERASPAGKARWPWFVHKWARGTALFPPL